MPNLLPRKKRGSYLRAIARSLGASVLFHTLVIALFAFGFSGQIRVARQDVGHNWLELGADILPSRAFRKSVAPGRTEPQSADAIVRSNAIVRKDDEAASAPDGAESRDVPSAEEGVARASAESKYISELAVLLNRAKRYPKESIAREQEGRVIVAVSVDRDGAVHETYIATPSPFQLLNDAALETVARIGKFPAPPAVLLTGVGEHGAGSRRLTIPISFRIANP